MGRRASRIADKGIYSEFDPKMKKLLDPDIAKRKEDFWKFKDKVKTIYPKAKPLMSLVAEQNCQQCEVRPWTRKYMASRHINDNAIFKMCGLCSAVFEELCKGKQIRIRLIDERLPY